jgi:hypothetical protein
MNPVKQNDLLFGLSQEEKIKHKLEEKFGTLTKLDKYNNFDFCNDKYFIEVKSRRIKHNRYDTLFFDEIKLKKAKEIIKKGYEIFFVFNCTDGIWCWEFKDDKMYENEYFISLGGRWDRGKEEISRMVNVKTEYLELLETKNI